MKSLKIISICVLILICMQNLSFAASGKIDTSGIEIGSTDQISVAKTFTGKIIGAFQVVGSIISVAALAIIGIRYMISSVEEKAEMKGVIIYYVVGAVLVFATMQLLGIAYDFISTLK